MKINVSEAQSTYLPLGYFRSCPVSVTAHYQVVAWRGESPKRKKMPPDKREKKGSGRGKKQKCLSCTAKLPHQETRAGRKQGGEPRQTCSSKYDASAEIDFCCIIGLTRNPQPLLAGTGSECSLACFGRCLPVLTLLLDSLAQTRISVFPMDDKSSCFICVHQVHSGI